MKVQEELHTIPVVGIRKRYDFMLKINSKPSPAEPGYVLPLQTV